MNWELVSVAIWENRFKQLYALLHAREMASRVKCLPSSCEDPSSDLQSPSEVQQGSAICEVAK